ncbi:hypothetical protein V5799_021365 [Amblyomma americanum]|uniref:Peptidase M13 N-terminal domain-containing protein n=1 Tax=Amblyomma americanum TaxID=6943 RepID=A0AAQ4FNQ8_AMBAM
MTHDEVVSPARCAVKVAPESHFLQPADATAPRKRRPLFNAVIIGVCLAICFAVVVIAVVVLSANPAPPANVCSTHECQVYGKVLTSSIDASERPCHNFTRFVCGGWQREHQLSVREELYERAIERMTRLVRTIDVPSSEQNSVERAAAVYHSCNNVLNGERDDLEAVKLSLLEAGITWPKHNSERDVVRTLLHSSLRFGWHVILRVVPRWSGQRMTLLVDPGGAFHFIVRRPRTVDANLQVYFGRLRDIFGSSERDDAKFEEVVDAENSFRDKLTAVYNDRMDYQDFPERTFLGLGESRWVEVLRKMNLTVSENLQLRTTGRRFLYAFFNLWDNYGEAGAYSFTAWCTVQVAALFANRELVLNYHGGSIRRAAAYHGAFCVTAAYTFSRYALLGSYHAEVLRGWTRPVAETMTRAVGDAFLKRLSRWRHLKSNIEVVANWSSLSRAFNGFDAVHDLALGPAGFDMTTSFVMNWRRSTLVPSSLDDMVLVAAINSLELFALYIVGERRHFQLLAAALSFPLFDLGLTAAVNYGGLGARVAWALGLLFLAAYGSDERSNELISHLKSCVASKSRTEDADAVTAVAVTAAALLDAFEADTEASRLPIPHVQGFTSTQLFFVALCFTLCEGSDSGGLAGVCDRSLKHVHRFAEAFECARGSPMHPAQRCELP